MPASSVKKQSIEFLQKKVNVDAFLKLNFGLKERLVELKSIFSYLFLVFVLHQVPDALVDALQRILLLAFNREVGCFVKMHRTVPDHAFTSIYHNSQAFLHLELKFAFRQIKVSHEVQDELLSRKKRCKN